MRRPLHASFLVLAFLLIYARFSGAEVLVYDAVAVKGRPVMLRAETRGRFLPRGGQLVEFEAGGRSLGVRLSGGDGVAFMEYTPLKAGLIDTAAASGGDKATGVVLGMEPGDGVVFIDVQNAVFEGLLSSSPRRGCVEKVSEIIRSENVVYLSSGPLGLRIDRARLRNGGLPDAPLLEWEGGAAFQRIADMGIEVKAVIGGADMLDSAREFSPKEFSFEEIEGAETVEGWEDVPIRF